MPDAPLRSDILGLSEVLKSLRDEVSDLRKQRAGEQNTSRSSIHVDAGGASAWASSRIAVVCSAFMAGISIGIVAMFVIAANERAELRRADNDFRDYISATYQVAPEFQKRIDGIKASKNAADESVNN